MFDDENHAIEYKSLKKLEGKSNLESLAKECVCFANAQGGMLYLGIEDKTKEPPKTQTISHELINQTLKSLKGFMNSVGLVNPLLCTHENGGEYFTLQVLPSLKTVAMTSSGKVTIRVGEECVPVDSQGLVQLVSEKADFQWELVRHKNVFLKDMPRENIDHFIYEIKNSKKLTTFLQASDDITLLEYFRLLDDGAMTNLGILWLGNHTQRTKISYPITVQYIVYNESEEKIRKEEWHFNNLNPKELLQEIEEKTTELRYFYELPKGLFREQIRQYHPTVIRELLVNAFVHQSYTISGDIFIKVYVDRLEIMSPGGLPLGITKKNILHQTRRKNPHLIEIFKAFDLMEGEGSGYDLIYEKLSKDAKLYPEIEHGVDFVKVTIYSTIISADILQLLDYAQAHFELSQKDTITLGVVAREKKISAIELSTILQLGDDVRLSRWVSSLVERKILITQGKSKGTSYLVNPELLKSVTHNIKPSLKTLEPHALKALLYEDLKMHPKSKMADILSRMPDVSVKDIRNILDSGAEDGEVSKEGAKKNRTYSLVNK